MIKIKDYILNENEISYIVGNTDDDRELKIQWKDNTSTYIKATFEDIEWNYEDKETNYLKYREKELKNYNDILDNQYQDKLKKIKELEEENKILKENAIHNDKVVDEAKWNENLYKSRIDKALDLIKKLKLLPTCEYDIEEQLDNLENRLKGEDNEI